MLALSFAKKIHGENYFHALYVDIVSKQQSVGSYCYCLILISLIPHLIQSSALLAGPLPSDCGKPHGATTDTLSHKLSQIIKLNITNDGF